MAERGPSTRAYLSHFLMVEEPFAPPPVGAFFSGAEREVVLRTLSHGVLERRGVSLLIGEAGTGKTILLDRLAQELDRSAFVLRLDRAPASPEDLLALLVERLGGIAPPDHPGSGRLSKELGALIAQAQDRGFPVVLLVDDAHRWDAPVLGALGRLLDSQGPGHRSLRILLVGRPELSALLSGPRCRDLALRVGSRRDLRPLRREEARRFVTALLEHAGVGGDLFEVGAHRRVFESSGGSAGRLSRLCDLALRSAFGEGRSRVTERDVARAVDELATSGAPAAPGALLPELPESSPPVGSRPGATWLGTTLLVAAAFLGGMLLVGGGLWIFLRSGIRSPAAQSAVSELETSEAEPAETGVASSASGDPSAQEGAALPATVVEQTRAGERLVRVVRGATVSELIEEIYGRWSLVLQDEVVRVNPSLEDVDFILPGQLIRFPQDPESSTLAEGSEGIDGPRSSY